MYVRNNKLVRSTVDKRYNVVVLYVIRKKPAKNVLVTKNTYKRVRANTRARNTTPSSNEIATIFFCTISFQATTLNLLCWRFSRSCSLPRVGYAIFANRDFGQDLRFLRDAREIRKTATIGLCACLSSGIVQSFARRRASRAGARAHPCARVFSHEYVFLLVFFELRRGLP